MSNSEDSAGLLEGEAITFIPALPAATASDEELNSKYAKGDVRIVTESARYSLAGILRMLEETVEPGPEENGVTERRYKLDPEYQRRHRWSTARKSRLIESFLMNVPVPPVFLYERDLAKFEVMDGRQRLTTLSEFYGNRFALEDLQYWPELNGRTYDQLPSKIKAGIDRRYISSVILLKETGTDDEQAALLKKIVFERLNSGGVELSSQETRNAIYPGPLNSLCLELSENEKFRRLWRIPSEGPAADASADDESSVEASGDSTSTGRRMFEKMEDVELVLRFFAYRQISTFKAGLNKISEYLDRFLIAGNSFDPVIISEYRAMFEESVDFVSDVIGPDGYCARSSNQSHRPTKIAYDPLMYAVNSAQVRPHHELLAKHRELFLEFLDNMYRDNAQLFSGRKTNYADTLTRNQVVLDSFVKAIAAAQEKDSAVSA